MSATEVANGQGLYIAGALDRERAAIEERTADVSQRDHAVDARLRLLGLHRLFEPGAARSASLDGAPDPPRLWAEESL